MFISSRNARKRMVIHHSASHNLEIFVIYLPLSAQRSWRFNVTNFRDEPLKGCEEA
jgi:hypothetical protein